MPPLPVIQPHSGAHREGVSSAAGGWSEADRDATARDLANAIEGEARFGVHDRMLYATDASLYQVEPLGVVIPSGVEDAVRAARFCIARGLPMLPRGGGTSLAGQCVNRAVVIDMSARCRGIGDVDPGRLLVRAEPGVYVEELNAELARRGTGLFFAPDPATVRQATIGGCIGNNAAGARSILFGRTSENLESVDALLATGERVTLGAGSARENGRVREVTERVADVVLRHAGLIRERYPRTVRRNAGYGLDLVLQMLEGRGAYAGGSGVENVNLAHLLAGSEGTLALTLGATLRLRPSPRAKGLAVLAFGTLDEAIGATLPILETGPSAVELLDDLVISLARDNAVARKQVELLPTLREGVVNAVLYVEYFAPNGPAEIEEKFARLRALIPGAAMAAYTGAGEMLQAWRLRQSGEPLLHGLPGERKPITFIEDNAIPVERLGEFVRAVRANLERRGTRGAFYAHASVGVLHVRPLLSIKDAGDRALLREIAVETAELARSLGGVMSGEHGDGRVRGPLLERFYGPELMRAFREVKAIFDPLNLMNPGMVVEPGPVASITARLRVDPGEGAHGREHPATEVRVPAVGTYYEYADLHGFEGAVEMCNGAGVCRKRQGGTMCPSYMALQDERHTTRGRANALRLAISGQLGDGAQGRGPAWGDAETLETLDLCLSCKACKSECPSNVDLARLKSEYLGQTFKARGEPPLSARITAEIRLVNWLGSLTPGLANAVNALAPVRALINRVMGMHPARSLPRFEPSLYGWFKRWRRARAAAAGGGRPRVVLYADCFTAFNEPGVGAAAAVLLEAFGYEVVMPTVGCCGRAAISTGVMDRAGAMAEAALARLKRYVDDEGVRAIVVCEPSCLSAMKDDWLDLRLDAPRELRRRLAAKAWLVEEFLGKFWDGHPARPVFAAPKGPVMLHGHCHQKALWGAESSAALLRRLAGDRLTVLDTGCCGMAGSFGFAERRFGLSNAIGELALYPAVRANPGAVLAAPGTSCRHQVLDALGVGAVHPVEYAASLLSGEPAGV